MESNVKNVNKDVIGVILVGIVLIMGVYIFTSLADIGGTTEYFSSSENSTMNTSSVFIAPVSDGVSSSSAKVYNQTWLNFDGVNDYVNLPKLIPSTETELTISCWVNSLTAGRYYISQLNDTTSKGIVLQKGSSNSAFELLIDGSSIITVNGLFISTGWKNLVVIYNKTGWVFYYNGVLNKTNLTSGFYGNYSDLSITRIGNRLSLDRAWNGSIDDCRFYYKALKSEDILYMYREGRK